MAVLRPPLYAEPDRLAVEETTPAERALEVVPAPTAAPSAPPSVAARATPPAPEHRVDLVEAGAFARARCAGCGWSGPARRSRAIAAADAADHPAPPAS